MQSRFMRPSPTPSVPAPEARPPLLERMGIWYFRALSRAARHRAATDPVHELNSEERASLRGIQRAAIVRAAAAGAVSSIVSAAAEIWVTPGHPEAAAANVDAPAGADLAGTDESAVAAHIDHPPEGAYCAVTGRNSGVFRWTVTRSGADVSAAVNKLAPVGEVHTIQAVTRGRSGRALVVEYIGTTGRHTVTGEYVNRKLLGNLKSGLWIVTREGGAAGRAPTTWSFRGGGFGHGVGLCQHGAIGQALGQRTFDQILKHYYPGSRLEKAW